MSSAYISDDITIMSGTLKRKRRERDKPKAAHDALYNPNKRVLLSYASDDEEDPEETVQDAGAPKSSVANGAVNGDSHGVRDGDDPQEAGDAQDLEGAQEAEHMPGPTSSHANQDGAAPVNQAGEGEEKVPEHSARYSTTTAEPTKQPRDHATGQWTAFGQEEDDDGSPNPAMDYLRAVQSERQTLPSVLQVSSAAGDYTVFNSDEAFIGTVQPQKKQKKLEGGPMGPREAFTEALKKRFLGQRHRLHLPPPPEAVAALDDSRPFRYPTKNAWTTQKVWVHWLANTAPLPAQIQSMTQDGVLGLLDLVQEHYLQREKEVNAITSVWIWSLLARLDEVGTMSNDQVYPVRALGKKAVLVQVSFRSSEAAAQLEDIVGSQNGAARDARTRETGGSSSKTVEQGEKSPPAPVETLADRENTLATLDSILVVVGDVFGQRDLLEFRQAWAPEDA